MEWSVTVKYPSCLRCSWYETILKKKRLAVILRKKGSVKRIEIINPREKIERNKSLRLKSLILWSVETSFYFSFPSCSCS
jgi:hypothetical protein